MLVPAKNVFTTVDDHSLIFWQDYRMSVVGLLLMAIQRSSTLCSNIVPDIVHDIGSDQPNAIGEPPFQVNLECYNYKFINFAYRKLI